MFISSLRFIFLSSKKTDSPSSWTYMCKKHLYLNLICQVVLKRIRVAINPEHPYIEDNSHNVLEFSVSYKLGQYPYIK